MVETGDRKSKEKTRKNKKRVEKRLREGGEGGGIGPPPDSLDKARIKLVYLFITMREPLDCEGGSSAPESSAMPVRSLAEDKPRILFYGAMMAIQNFGLLRARAALRGALARRVARRI